MTGDTAVPRGRRVASRLAGAVRHRVVVLLAAACALPGCSGLEYYWQGVAGQFDLLARARPIAEVVATTDDPALRASLLRVQEIRAFASRELALPANGSYTRYADLGRPFVVWNVFAAPELSLTLRQWCYPVPGCVAYRGYFALADARAEADRLAGAGFDVHLSGVPAYSTLGYFDDPVLSTFVGFREVALARLVFHELAHQVVYVRDDTSFNESFATAVEEAGLARWLAANASRPDAGALAADAARSRRLRADFRRLVEATRERLATIFASAAPEAEKRERKAEAFAAMRAEYARLRAGWDGAPAYDGWFADGANNAGIAAMQLYADRVPQFTALLAAEGGDFARFFDRVRALAALPRADRDAALRAVAP